ncbi:MAG: RDD family protein, partial [Pseudobdellovibrionaceae bacterium]
MQPASISSRFSAMNLDWIIFGALWQAFSMFFNAFIPELMTQTNSLVLCFLASFFYFAYPTKKSGQTLGKKLLSLKVIPLAREKEALSWPQVFLREGVGKLLSLLPLCLGYAWAFTNPERKAWHDSLSRTQVVSLVLEEEKTTLQKLQNILLGILSIPLGVAMILGVILYTPLPLDSIKENIEASGIQVGALTGSLAMGLHFSEIKRQDKEQSFDLGSIDVKCNLPALVYERIFVIEKLTVEEGHIEVPENFSWATIFVN